MKDVGTPPINHSGMHHWKFFKDFVRSKILESTGTKGVFLVSLEGDVFRNDSLIPAYFYLQSLVF